MVLVRLLMLAIFHPVQKEKQSQYLQYINALDTFEPEQKLLMERYFTDLFVFNMLTSLA